MPPRGNQNEPILPHRRNAWASAVFRRYARRLVARHFNALRLARGCEQAIETLHNHPGPTIVLLNHQSWWDPILSAAMADTITARRPVYAPMDRAMLERFAFMRRLGLFGVDLDDPQAGPAMVRYAAGLLTRQPNASLWITPQGRLADVPRPPAAAAGCGGHRQHPGPRRPPPGRSVPGHRAGLLGRPPARGLRARAGLPAAGSTGRHRQLAPADDRHHALGDGRPGPARHRARPVGLPPGPWARRHRHAPGLRPDAAPDRPARAHHRPPAARPRRAHRRPPIGHSRFRPGHPIGRFRLCRGARLVTPPVVLLIVLLGLGLALALGALGLTLSNLRLYRKPPPGPGPSVRVSVCIPARNEEANIEPCVRSILAGTHRDLEVVVCDDQSEDRTARILAALAREDARVRPIASGSLPAGWVGKQHACWRCAQEATGDLLLFTDADVRFEPTAIAQALAAWGRSSTPPPTGPASDRPLGLISTFPRQVVRTPGEWLLVPMIFFLLFSYLPMGRMRRTTDPAASAACGQFILISRACYDAVGGHKAICDSMHDGVKLPRVVRKGGYRTDLFDGTRLCHVRMYHGWHAAWKGFAKNAYEGLGSLPALVALSSAVHLVGHVLPWAAAAGLLALGNPSSLALALALAACGVHVLAPRGAGPSLRPAVDHGRDAPPGRRADAAGAVGQLPLEPNRPAGMARPGRRGVGVLARWPMSLAVVPGGACGRCSRASRRVEGVPPGRGRPAGLGASRRVGGVPPGWGAGPVRVPAELLAGGFSCVVRPMDGLPVQCHRDDVTTFTTPPASAHARRGVLPDARAVAHPRHRPASALPDDPVPAGGRRRL
ncbi:MAG: hypothetical protein KatS3mg103_0243 [Phycisphaerales bacterium]|nr:MAG: hypothetical protein KatS3mg103_0243 [Phycisphaerales bacterium]